MKDLLKAIGFMLSIILIPFGLISLLLIKLENPPKSEIKLAEAYRFAKENKDNRVILIIYNANTNLNVQEVDVFLELEHTKYLLGKVYHNKGVRDYTFDISQFLREFGKKVPRLYRIVFGGNPDSAYFGHYEILWDKNGN